MLHSACWIESVPLTLTLSLREREQQASDWCFADGNLANAGTGVIERRWTILPLPRERAACLPRRRRQAAQAGGEGEPCVVHPTFQSANC